MTDEATEIRTSVEVSLPPDQAFTLFTTGIERWWPAEYSLSGELAASGVDPQVGGRLWQRNTAGETCTWGHVLTWDPPRTFAFSWLIGPDWGVPAADAPGSRVRVAFEPTASGTRVELVHDRLDAHGEQWQDLRDSVAAEDGWPGLLARYRNAA